MQDSDRKHILRRIAEVENRITGLQEEQEEAQATLRALRIQLAHADPQICITHKDTDEAHVSEHLTPAEKVALFLRLFRGRDDVYLCAALSTGDLGVIALFGSQQTTTLPLLLYQRLGAYQMNEAAVTALILLLLCLSLFVAIERVFGGRQRA
jgi:hypothetical protein